MTAAYLKTSSRTLPNGVVLVCTNLVLVYATVFFCYLPACKEVSLLYKGRMVQSRWAL